MLFPDILNENCSDISDWTDADGGTGVSEVDPAGQFRFDTNLGAAGDAYCWRHRTIITPPNTFTAEIKTYFDSLGTKANNDDIQFEYQNTSWIFRASFGADGLFISKVSGLTGEVSTNIVQCNATAAEQTWRFQVNKTSESVATVEVFLDNISQGTFDCDHEHSQTGDGRVSIFQKGYTTDNMVSHIHYIKIATGLGEIYGDSTSDFLQLF